MASVCNEEGQTFVGSSSTPVASLPLVIREKRTVFALLDIKLYEGDKSIMTFILLRGSV